MASYAEMDEETLQAMLGDAESYEERSLIRQALRQKKKERGELVKRPRGKGSVYNRFASSARSTAPSPKNYVASAQSVKPKTETPPRRATPETPPPRRATPVEQVDVSPHVEEDPQPSPPPREPTPPPPREPTPPPPREPTPPPREPTPPPREPTPPPLTPPSTPPPQESPSPPTPEEEFDGCSDPGVGEEGVAQSPPPAEEEEESVETPHSETPHKARERTIEEDTDGSRSAHRAAQTNVDFGVKLKATPPKTQKKPSTRPSPSESTQPSPSAPRTLRDYQELSARSKASRPLTPEDRPIAGNELQQYLVAYVNRELALRPPLPARGRALFETAADPANLCKLINKSVKDTVDLRALTKMPARGSAAAKREALEENMMLAVESARAIGCRVTDDTGDKILSGDPDIIRAFLVDLIRSRVVHMPAMDDEPSSTFTNLPLLFSKLDICVESVDGGEVEEETTPTDTHPSQDKEAVTYEERAAVRREERERKRSGEPADQGQEMTYEERAAKRKLDRERRRKEREALAK